MSIPSSQLKLIVSIVAVFLVILHFARPDIAIDATTLILLGIAFFPWLLPVFKSIEFPGGLKIELNDLEKIAQQAKESGLFAKKKKAIKRQYSFESLTQTDPNLALAGLRIEIERLLRKIASANDIDAHMSLIVLVRTLVREDGLSEEEGVVLSELLALLNQAVHGARVDTEASSWAMTTGISILEALETKV